MAAAATLPAAVPSMPAPQPLASAPAAPATADKVAARAVRVATPQIHWHGKSPIFAIDFHPKNPRLFATAGVEPDGVGGLHMWVIHDGAGEPPVEGQPPASPVSFIQALEGHEKPINCLRFSPNGEFLASAGVEGLVVLWKRDLAAPTPAAALAGAERWEHFAILRAHVLDVADIAWSPSSLFLASGSTDNTCTIFNVFSKQDKVAATIRDHSHFVLGVAWDPQDEYVLTSSSDRSCRVHSSPSGRWKNDCKTNYIASKMEFASGGASTKKLGSPDAKIEIEDDKKKKDSQHFKLFLDDSLAAHRRRPAWSPDGLYCIVPGGVFQASASATPTHVSHILARRSPTKPLAYLPCGKQPAIAVRFCPVLFKMGGAAAADAEEGQHAPPAQGTEGGDAGSADARASPVPGASVGTAGGGEEGAAGGDVRLPTPSRLFEGQRHASESVLNTAYRTIFAVATQDSILLYDSSSLARPLLYLSGIHFTPLSDLAWSADGRFLMATSSDGYCTIIEFQPGELGEPLEEKDVPLAARPKLIGAAQLAAAAAAMEEAANPMEQQAQAQAPAPAADPASKKRRIIPSVFKQAAAAAQGGGAGSNAPITVGDAPDASAAAAPAPAQEGAVEDTSKAQEEAKKKRRIVPTVVSGDVPAPAPQ